MDPHDSDLRNRTVQQRLNWKGGDGGKFAFEGPFLLRLVKTPGKHVRKILVKKFTHFW